MEDIEISILMPIYNPPLSFLKKSLESIIYQTYKNIEIILILDGSNSKIENICRKYQSKNNKIRIYKQENKGEGASRNKAIELAKNKYILFVDSDDYLEKDVLKNLTDRIKKEKKEPDIVIFDAYVEYKKKQVENSFYNKEGILNTDAKEEIQLQNIGKGECEYYPDDCNVSVVWGKLYNKEFLEKKDLKFVEGIKRMPDTIFNMYAFENATTIAHYNVYGYHYFKNENSVTAKYDPNIQNDIKIFLETIQKYIEKYNKNERFKRLFNITVLEMMARKIENSIEFETEEEIKKWINQFLKNEDYKKALEDLKNVKKTLSIYKRLFSYFVIKRNIKGIKTIYRFKKKIKEIKNKENQVEDLKIESLISIMNLKDLEEAETFIKKANIEENSLFVNQVDNKKNIFNYEDENKKINSFLEKGVSKSRNKALELATTDICILADDDVRYEKSYKNIIISAYKKYKKADVIIFYVESKNLARKIKKMKKGKVHWTDLMKARTDGITFRLDKVKENKIKFDNNFGPGGTFLKGEETIFLYDCYKKKLKIYSEPIKLAIVENKESTWFEGFNKKFFYDQGAIFARIQPRLYRILIIQYLIRKYGLYNKKYRMCEVYKIMLDGAKNFIKLYN